MENIIYAKMIQQYNYGNLDFGKMMQSQYRIVSNQPPQAWTDPANSCHFCSISIVDAIGSSRTLRSISKAHQNGNKP